MTKSKLLTPIDKTQSSYKNKVNNLKEVMLNLTKKIEKYKKQIQMDYEFKEILKKKYPETYKEIVKGLLSALEDVKKGDYIILEK